MEAENLNISFDSSYAYYRTLQQASKSKAPFKNTVK